MSRLRLASWNVNSLKVRLPQVLDWLESAKIDALVMQETKTTDDVFPQAAFAEAGFDVFFLGQKTYNGVALCSRQTTVKTSDVVLGLPGWPDPQKRFISALLSPLAAPEQPPIRFCGGYFPNGQAVGSSKYLYKLDWIAVLERTLKTYLADTPRLVLGGDFNIAPADADVWKLGAERFSAQSRSERHSSASLHSAFTTASDSLRSPQSAFLGGTIVRAVSNAITACALICCLFPKHSKGLLKAHPLTTALAAILSLQIMRRLCWTSHSK